MRTAFIFIIYSFVFFSCHNANNTKIVSESTNKEKEDQVFFPVTDFFNGQLLGIREKGAAPLKYTISNKKTDSLWLNMNNLAESFSDFLSPEIDSIKLASYYTMKKFYDQTLNEITLTYEANKQLPDSIPWLSWNVYIDPEKGTIDRIYLLKRVSPINNLQLLWLANKKCKITSIIDKNDTAYVDREINISWDY